ncbi:MULTISPECIES: hypothetical protein [Psychrobacter]|jgi:hypothetical protein|uniref:Glycosyl transferase family 28 C-terminal domain-containing protein n=1 Tax=Psychrobacter faecalis TaxID=180588 RepID=A0ABT9HIZ5_9GAMM|nr:MULTISPECIES: hypothetical protein [Psychrobacter]MDP4545414.1 hypothetical protein [Psychrobacter faecalis]WLW65267.1 hypothetical protein RAH45_07305 [Psychrobacter sp. van23A]
MRLGYYAHHHGSGHCRQIDKLAALLPTEARQQLTVFTSLTSDTYTFAAIDEAQVVRLPAEDERADDVLAGRAGQYWQPTSLHYSPVGNSDIQQRSHKILDTIYQRRIDLMIIDVSVEVAMLCRAVSVPYLYVRLPGIRDDVPHLNAFAGALALLAPYPRTLESAMTLDWLAKKTLYLDFINTEQRDAQTYQVFIKHLMQLTTDEKALSLMLNDKDKDTPTIVTVIKGYGGHQAIDAKLPELRQLLPHAFIISLGPIDEDKRHYVDIAVDVSDVTPFIVHSDYLLMACGLNAVAQACDYATPLVVLPDDRPHQEQEVMAEALIIQGRALSWQQFKDLMIASVTHKLSGKTVNQSARIQSLSKPDNATLKQKSVQTAQAFMQSMAEYPTTKAWFEQWLLPQLALKPER